MCVNLMLTFSKPLTLCLTVHWLVTELGYTTNKKLCTDIYNNIDKSSLVKLYF